MMAKLAANCAGSRAILIASLTPWGSMPNWVTATDTTSAPTVPSRTGQ